MSATRDLADTNRRLLVVARLAKRMMAQAPFLDAGLPADHRPLTREACEETALAAALCWSSTGGDLVAVACLHQLAPERLAEVWPEIVVESWRRLVEAAPRPQGPGQLGRPSAEQQWHRDLAFQIGCIEAVVKADARSIEIEREARARQARAHACARMRKGGRLMDMEHQPLWWVEATDRNGTGHRILVQGTDTADAGRNAVSKLHRIAGEVRVTGVELAAADLLGGHGGRGPRRIRSRIKAVTRTGLIVGHGDTEAETIASIRPGVRAREAWWLVEATSRGPDGRGAGAPLPPDTVTGLGWIAS